MDARHFDTLARSLTEAGTRRGLLGLLATMPILGGLFALLDFDETDAKGRRKRRKKAHKHGRPRPHGKRKKKKCKPNALAKTCSGKCGSVKNNCKKTVDCGSCACDPPCETCFTCQENPGATGTCVQDAVGTPCGDPGQVCQADSACACAADSCRNPTPICADQVCVACTASNQCPVDTICDDDSCLACDVCPTCSYTTVQAAVADPSGPNVIRVCPGAYTESIIIGRALSLIGAGAGSAAGNTTLQSAGSNVVRISDGVGDVTLQALRISGGTGSTGGGVQHLGTSLTLNDCAVTDNTSSDRGGGVFVGLGRTLVMDDCIVSRNTATNASEGGGLYNDGGTVTLFACVIDENVAAASDGGGLASNGGSVELQSGTVLLNSAVGGGGIFVSNSGTVTLFGCLAQLNTATDASRGGGIRNSDSTVNLEGGSTVDGNTAPNCVSVDGGTFTGSGCGP